MNYRWVRLQVWWHEKVRRHTVNVGGDIATRPCDGGGFAYWPTRMAVKCSCGVVWQASRMVMAVLIYFGVLLVDGAAPARADCGTDPQACVTNDPPPTNPPIWWPYRGDCQASPYWGQVGQMCRN